MPSSDARSLGLTVARRVAERGPASPEEARRWIASVFSALGAMLTLDERRHVVAALPVVWGHALSARAYHSGMNVEELYHACDATSAALPARERVQVVCSALGELLPYDVLERLRRALPADVGALLSPPRSSIAPAADDDGTTTGCPGESFASGVPETKRSSANATHDKR